MKNSFGLLFVFLISVSLAFVGCAPPPPADLIMHGGQIVTMAPGQAGGAPGPEAILVREGRIFAVGTLKEIEAQKSANTEVVDLGGRVLLPGFISPHTHPELSAYLYSFVDMSGFSNRTPDQVWERLRTAVAQAEPGQWIFCKGFDPMLVPGLKAPTIQELDKIAPNNPVAIIAQSLHSAWANSAAFRELEITPETPDPAPGSFYEKDADGKLTGFISEVAAIGPFTKAALKVIDIKESMQGVLREYAANGITSIATAGLFAKDDKPLLLLEHLSTRSPGLKHDALEAVGLLPERVPAVRNFIYLKADTPFLFPDEIENGDDFFKIVGIKLWYDGSPYTGSMYLSQPYLDSPLMRDGLKVAPGSRGKAVLTREEFREQIAKFHEQGWQMAIHSQGDQSARDIVADMGALLKKSPRADHRHRLEHGLLIPADLLGRIKNLGISPSFHVNHLYYYGESLRDGIIGPARAAAILPAGSSARNGLTFTLHADQPMYPEDPLSLMATATTRKTRNGSLLGPFEAIPAYAALKSMTVDAAWQVGMEKKLGSIEVGKYADLVILDRNPLRVAPDGWREIKVMRTFVAGQEIWKR